jgi:hypothetical protein
MAIGKDLIESFKVHDRYYQVKVPWFETPLWIFPLQSDAEILVKEGVPRGLVYTADELAGLSGTKGGSAPVWRALVMVRAAMGTVQFIETRKLLG